jgi:hypothetical protein
MKNFCISLSLIFYFGAINPVFAMKDEKPSVSISYKLPKEVDPNQLLKSSVMIHCGGGRGTGIAIGERHILTAAHVVGAYALDKQPVDCAAVNEVKDLYFIPVSKSNVDSQGVQCFKPDFSGNDMLGNAKVFNKFNISNVYFHEGTSFREVEDPQIKMNLKDINEKYKETMRYGIDSAEKLASMGIKSDFIKAGQSTPTSFRVFGPDLAILECDVPHNLPFLEIADPIKEDRTLVHIIGLSGLRYKNDDRAQPPLGGTVCHLGNEPSYVYIPRIIGQRFKCLPAYENGLKRWINRPFMKVVSQYKYLMDDEIYPNAPEGFGLIASGDSGSGAIIVSNGQPYVVGVASSGNIEPVFRTISDCFSQTDLKEIGKDKDGEELIMSYWNSFKSEDKNDKWFITQGLADATHIKAWVNSIVLKK